MSDNHDIDYSKLPNGPITLTLAEMAMAAGVGVRRQLSSIYQNLQGAHGVNNEEQGWQINIEGACGEQVVAKLLGLYWNGSVNSFKQPDVSNFHVRTRSPHTKTKGLPIRPNDPDDGIFILVIGACPNYQVVGWLRARDGKQSQWNVVGFNGRPDAYFVPESELLPMDRLHKEIV